MTSTNGLKNNIPQAKGALPINNKNLLERV